MGRGLHLEFPFFGVFIGLIFVVRAILVKNGRFAAGIVSMCKLVYARVAQW